MLGLELEGLDRVAFDGDALLGERTRRSELVEQLPKEPIERVVRLLELIFQEL